MSEQEQPVRAEAVQAVIDALVDLDPNALQGIGHLTPAERRAGEEAARQVIEARQPDNSRKARVWILLAEGGFRAGMTWEEAWEAQDDEHRHRIAALFDALPEPLLPIVGPWREERGL